MADQKGTTLLTVVYPWPIAIALATHLPAGDLISLARTSSLFRAALHGFASPRASDDESTNFAGSRKSLRIGSHQTSYWKQLKSAAPFLCASPTHTRGPGPRPCRYCSTPICQTCIVRDSFAKSEKTFRNRCRFLCKACWSAGNPHKKSRFVDDPGRSRESSSYYIFAPGHGEFCVCTNRNDGWVCLPCKEIQNAEATTFGSTKCFGQECEEALEDDKERRRICLWCDRPMLRGRASMECRVAFDHKIRENYSRRDLDLEGHSDKRQKLYKMSRRELRGNDAVAEDPLADAPQFVRHLDTVNYQRFVQSRDATPSGDQIYESKLGKWKYNPAFLLAFRSKCAKLPEPGAFQESMETFYKPSRKTNLEKWNEEFEKMVKLHDDGAGHENLYNPNETFQSSAKIPVETIVVESAGDVLENLLPPSSQRRSIPMPIILGSSRRSRRKVLTHDSRDNTDSQFDSASALPTEEDMMTIRRLQPQWNSTWTGRSAVAEPDVGSLRSQNKFTSASSDAENSRARNDPFGVQAQAEFGDDRPQYEAIDSKDSLLHFEDLRLDRRKNYLRIVQRKVEEESHGCCLIHRADTQSTPGATSSVVTNAERGFKPDEMEVNNSPLLVVPPRVTSDDQPPPYFP